MKHLGILIFLFSVSFLNAQSADIPKDIDALLVHRPNMPNKIAARTQKNNSTYYIIVELDSIENTQALIEVKETGSPKLMDRQPLIFPLKKYISDEEIIKDLAKQYVQFLISENPSGKEGIQESLDCNPAAFSPTAPELIEAYQNAGLEIPEPE